jgi:hypothetical protein
MHEKFLIFDRPLIRRTHDVGEATSNVDDVGDSESQAADSTDMRASEMPHRYVFPGIACADVPLLMLIQSLQCTLCHLSRRYEARNLVPCAVRAFLLPPISFRSWDHNMHRGRVSLPSSMLLTESPHGRAARCIRATRPSSTTFAAQESYRIQHGIQRPLILSPAHLLGIPRFHHTYGQRK